MYTFTEMNINVFFGKEIKKIRLSKKISQEKLALDAEIDRTYITDIENGNRNVSLTIAFKLTNALDVPFSKLFKDL